MTENFKKDMLAQLLPVLLNCSKFQDEDYSKLRNDQTYSQTVGQNKDWSKKTLRTLVLQLFEKLTEKYEEDCFFALKPAFEKNL